FSAASAQARFAAIEELGRRGLIEWAVVDPGSVNLDGLVYTNPDEHIRHGLALAAQHGLHPGYAIYEAGFVRLGAALARAHNGLRQPVYRFMFSETFIFVFTPDGCALAASLQLP